MMNAHSVLHLTLCIILFLAFILTFDDAFKIILSSLLHTTPDFTTVATFYITLDAIF